ncbi:MAG: dihydrofolate reductase [Eubacteriales bacterium]
MTAIVAVDRRWGIGRGDSLLYRISPDLKRFRKLTLGKTVVMGHSTLLTMPDKKPLGGRNNIILSRDKKLKIDNAAVIHSEQELFAFTAEPDDLFVIGGESVYRLFLPYCSRVYVTKIYETAPDADKFFPDLDADPNWTALPVSDIIEDNGIRFQYFEYINNTPAKGWIES